MNCLFVLLRNVTIKIHLASQIQGLLLLAHLSRRLIGELLVYPFPGAIRRPSSVVHPFTISNIFSKTAWPIKAKCYVEPPWVGETKVCSWHLGHMTRMVTRPYMVKTLQKSSSDPAGRFPRNLVHVCSIRDSRPS